ncbi:class I SAM-dependent methyltransferase [Gordonia desulfuricans]|uniref:Class I SAM-dependent methyltransferase n=1 Tax=Gordonia desulfuricans TaxID=89051 RepID=A0A7K3LQW9_9ACTN|nr:class I SAM-dependent methyltransferase [Gordonia desulfuricans]NDK90633.1 class I SAM-dependent methyltransferase [Gordonia desulfuricans]
MPSDETPAPRPPRVLDAVDSTTSVRANRSWWDGESQEYHREHGDFLGSDAAGGDFVWCPERLREEDARLLGDVAGKTVLEIGCGSAPCSRWLAGQGAHVAALDLSHGMLEHGLEAMDRLDHRRIPLIQASAEDLPFADGSFDLVFSSFGAVPFVADSARVMAEAARVLKSGGRWVFSINHPMRWMFPDDPGPAGLTVAIPYFNRTPYSEADADGVITYVEHHRTIGDRVREIRAAGLVLDDIVEPEWPDDLDREWGQWSPLRGYYFPGTAIFCSRKP